jgi:hypothetical protein
LWITTVTRPRSSGARKRGSVTVLTTGSRTVTACSAFPSLLALQATAITRRRPLKSGTSSETVASPFSSALTMPE